MTPATESQVPQLQLFLLPAQQIPVPWHVGQFLLGGFGTASTYFHTLTETGFRFLQLNGMIPVVGLYVNGP